MGESRRSALLLRLLVDGNRVVGAGRLAEDLWEGSPPPGAAATLQSDVSHLRQVVGDRLETAGHGYRLRVEPGELDAAVFDAEVDRGCTALAEGDAREAAEALSQALAR